MQHCLRPGRLQSVSSPPVVQFIFFLLRELLPSCVGGICCFLLLYFAFIRFQGLFKCCHCVLLKSAKGPEHGQRTKSRFSHQKMPQARKAIWRPSQHWLIPAVTPNSNFMSGKELINGTRKLNAPCRPGCEQLSVCEKDRHLVFYISNLTIELQEGL